MTQTVVGYTKFKCDRCGSRWPEKGNNPLPVKTAICGTCARNPAHRGPVSMIPVKDSAVAAS